ncbi:MULTISPECIES: MSMEG_0565 family glycosyltransferase [unclassified Pseudonocardia]|uniref:MSMEG_0565 family glycosyltransferase n=1 Tax=unclassified Pseudonocardia TaxID=2619320 RepID=UPI00094B0C4F|nr:MSMEG_0565 family glycosyltransferase [Pseudonocardia sp. Ae707_Ps1]OLM19631.1 Glycosyl transferase, group 1 [Pseudonocardia sp. Ae707_Ps1]
MRTDRLRIRLSTYSTKPRGGVVHTLALAEALAAAGHDVEVWSLARGGDTGFFRRVAPDVGVRLVPVPDVDGESVGARILRSIDLLADALGSAPEVDVRHAQDCLSANAEGRAHGDGSLLRTVHHLDEFTTPELAACHERAIVSPAALVCVSRAVATEVRDGWGRDATVIGNGVDAARFARAADSGAGTAWRARFGSYVLSVGGIEPRKGTGDLVEAMALLPDLRLVVGGGETLFDYRGYRAGVLARADALGVRPEILGPVDDDELPGLMAGAAAFAFPSVKEGFGLAAMEALAAGVPLVTRDLPVLREVFDGAARFAAEPAGFAAALRAAVAEPDPHRERAGRELAAAHSWATAADRHLRLYEDFLGAGVPCPVR